jgi:hypothetical protein
MSVANCYIRPWHHDELLSIRISKLFFGVVSLGDGGCGVILENHCTSEMARPLKLCLTSRRFQARLNDCAGEAVIPPRLGLKVHRIEVSNV